MAQHNIVITGLPYAEYRTASAAAGARDVVRTLHNIRVGFMVGIGGGAQPLSMIFGLVTS